jgi:hypothetical protein
LTQGRRLPIIRLSSTPKNRSCLRVHLLTICPDMTTTLKRLMASVLIPSLLLVGTPLMAQAGIVSTEQALTQETVSPDAGTSRERVAAFFSRDDVRAELQAQGVNADDTLARVQAMSDTEVAQLAQRVDQAPAGAGVVGVLFTVFLILLVTDILGFTKVFPFTRAMR